MSVQSGLGDAKEQTSVEEWTSVDEHQRQQYILQFLDEQTINSPTYRRPKDDPVPSPDQDLTESPSQSVKSMCSSLIKSFNDKEHDISSKLLSEFKMILTRYADNTSYDEATQAVARAEASARAAQSEWSGSEARGDC